ncbi:MAG: PaaI family thioesterase [Geminicoccaceae bacterium]|nr:PaaI family thioesterase [Geminicoccaceae bacterium]MCX8100513.1 PaaI family thioesterase [Geminicoccaceae bacterium]MDW8371332.1 PaaI family thioesterase [Geminicoccaceae bacterium]
MSAARVEDGAAVEARVRGAFAAQGLVRLLGAELLAVAPGRVAIGLPFRSEFGQQDGFFHGGILATLGDDAAGFAALSLMPPDHRVLTVEFKINFLAPGLGERAIARGEVVRSGRTLTVARAEVAVVQRGSERPVALLLATMMSLPSAAPP